MDWFYHDPGQGRVGPLSADDLRNRFRDRRIQRDTLVWRHGLPEWQPLERLADELDLLSVQPDARQPPPLPPSGMSGAGSAAAAVTYAPPPHAGRAAAPAYRPAPPRKQGMSGCLIALIVCGALAVPMIGILAAIALPAYNDYVMRSKVAQQADVRASAIKVQVLEARERLGHCPGDASEAGVPNADNVRFGQLADGRCAFEVTLRDAKAQLDGKTIVYAEPTPPSSQWDCAGGDLPARYRTPACRPATDTTR